MTDWGADSLPSPICIVDNHLTFTVVINAITLLSNTYAYDNLGRLASVTQGSDTISYSYDANGNVVQKVVDGNTVSYEYNKAGLRISDIYGENSPLNTQYTYYLDGSMKSKSGANYL